MAAQARGRNGRYIRAKSSSYAGSRRVVAAGDKNSVSVPKTLVASSNLLVAPKRLQPGLPSLPLEMLNHIASNFDPASLRELSGVSSRFRDMLYHENGNLLWYRALPPSLMGSSTIHQQLRAPWIPRPSSGSVVLPGHVELLGAAYDSAVNYKFEFFGRWKSKIHCNICFATRDDKGATVKDVVWGRTWCGPCFARYSIS